MSSRGNASPKGANVAIAVVAPLTVNVQLPVPVQGPSQPVNCMFAAGVAVSVTDVPFANESEQVAPQLMAPTLLMTVPEPLPGLVIVTVELTSSAALAGAAAAAMIAMKKTAKSFAGVEPDAIMGSSFEVGSDGRPISLAPGRQPKNSLAERR